MVEKRTKILIATCIGIFLCMLDTTVMNITLPAIQNSFDVSLSQLSWALNVYTIFFASLTIPLSRFSDYVGRERLYVISLVLFILSSLLCGMSQSLQMLIIGRIFQGISASIIFPLSMIIGISTVNVSKRRRVVAFLGVSQGFAAAVGPTVGGVITQYLGWNWVFFINIPLVVISLTLCFSEFEFKGKIKLKNIKSIDYKGSLLGMGCLFTFTTVLIKINDWGVSSFNVIFLTLITIILGSLFIFNERKHKDPIVPLSIFKNRQFFATSITVILSNIFLIGIMVTVPSMLTNIEGYTELKSALLITPISIMIFIFSPISAILIKKIGAKVMIGAGFLAMTVGYFLLSYINYTNITQFAITCAIIGFGYGIIIGPATLLAASDFEGEMLTASQSIIGVVRQIGIIIGVSLFIALLTTNIENAKVYSINNANQIVDAADINDDLKVQIKDQVKSSIQAGQSQEVEQSYVSAQQRKEIIDKKYDKEIENDKLSKQEQKVIYEQIEQEVDSQLVKINKEIKEVSDNISKTTMQYMLEAFIYIYKRFILLVFLSTFIVILFPKIKR